MPFTTMGQPPEAFGAHRGTTPRFPIVAAVAPLPRQTVTEKRPTPTVTLERGPVGPKGYRFAIGLSGFAPATTIAISCRDSANPGGFFRFHLLTNANGRASTDSYCFSADGPDHWVVASGVESNHVRWSMPAEASPRGDSYFSSQFSTRGWREAGDLCQSHGPANSRRSNHLSLVICSLC
jgi:hypothetical protein